MSGPVVMAGGKKIPEPAALQMAYRAVQEGAAGVDMGRNIFQSMSPAAMIQAVQRVVHDDASPAEAHELFSPPSPFGRGCVCAHLPPHLRRSAISARSRHRQPATLSQNSLTG